MVAPPPDSARVAHFATGPSFVNRPAGSGVVGVVAPPPDSARVAHFATGLSFVNRPAGSKHSVSGCYVGLFAVRRRVWLRWGGREPRAGAGGNLFVLFTM